MSPRARNTILSMIAAFAVLLIAAFVALLSGAVTADYQRSGILMFIVTGVSIIIAIVVATHDDDKQDKIEVGFLFGAMAVMSVMAGLGIYLKVFNSADLARTILVWVTGIDALLSSIYWAYTNFWNDDFTVV